MKKRIMAIAVSGACLLSLSCATVFSGTYQSIPLTSNPAGASVKIINEAHRIIFEGETPCTVRALKNNLRNATVEIKLEGYVPVKIQLGDKLDGVTLFNCCLPGVGWIFGFGGDIITGSYRKIDPEKIVVDLKKSTIAKPNSGDNGLTVINAGQEDVAGARIMVSIISMEDNTCTLSFTGM